MTALTGLSVEELRPLLDARRISAAELTRAHLERIEQLDSSLGAFLRVNPRAGHEAAAADAEIAAGRRRPLTGIPVAIKDNIATANLETTCGSRMLDGFVPPRDATAVRRLREAGAVILGKTNLDEFGMGSSTENSAFRPTRNPWDVTRVPGGSSGGSAVAVAAGMAPLALGSDTGGSVRQPAAFCGTVGLKPTYGRVSRSGLVAFGSSLDQVGVLARCVVDAATTLTCIAGEDELDMTCSTREPGDYVAACAAGVRGLQVGLPAEYAGAGLDEGIAAVLTTAAAELEGQGAALRAVSLPHTRYAIPTYYLVATAEASSNLARFDAVRFGRRRAGATEIAAMYAASRGAGFGAEVKRRIMLGTFGLAAGYHDDFYGRAQRARTLLRRDFDEAFASGVDVLLAPATPTTAFGLGEKVDDPLAMYLSDVFTVPASLAGLPALVVPVGRDAGGLPIGIQLIAPRFGEDTLCRAGAVLEWSRDAAPALPPEGGTSDPGGAG